MLKGINFKEVALKAAGHTGGAIVAGKLSKVKFIANLSKDAAGVEDPKKAALKGAVIAAIGYIGIPMVAKKLKMAGKKNNLVEALGEGCGMIGMLQVANSFDKDDKWGVPNISGLEGYEQNPITGLGELYEEEESFVNGYESNPAISNDASGNFMDVDA